MEITKDVSRFKKWEVLALLWLCFFLNQGDRQVFNTVLPLIRDDLGLTEATLGGVASLFLMVFAVFVLASGYLADRFSKKWVIVLSVLFWSVAAIFTGMGTVLIHLLIFRSFAAMGEASFAPSNYAMIGDYHHKTRSMAMSIHQTSLYVGVIVSGFLAGWIGENLGWRYAFYIYGSLGVLLGSVLIFRLKDYKLPEKEVPIETPKKPSLKKAFTILFTNPTAILLTLAFACMVFVNVGYLTWAPTLLHEKFDLSLANAGFSSMFYFNVCAFVGILFAGKFTDNLVQKKRNSRLTVQAWGMLLAAPFILLMGNSASLDVVYFALAGFGLFRALYDANIYASLYDVIEAKYRASVSGVMIFFAFITGAASPYLLGSLKPVLGLAEALGLLSVISLLSALFIFIAKHYFFAKDYVVENH